MIKMMEAQLEIAGIDIEVRWYNSGGTDTGYQDAHHGPEDELDRPDNQIIWCVPSLAELKELGISEAEVQEKIDAL